MLHYIFLLNFKQLSPFFSSQSYDKKMIGRSGKLQIVYDTEKQRIVNSLGTPEIFPDPEGDIALSPNGEWLVNGYKNKKDAVKIQHYKHDAVT